MMNGVGGVEMGDWMVLGGDVVRICDVVFVCE